MPQTQAILELHTEQKQKEREEFPGDLCTANDTGLLHMDCNFIADRFVYKRALKKSSPGISTEPTKLPEIIVKQKELPSPPSAGGIEVT